MALYHYEQDRVRLTDNVYRNSAIQMLGKQNCFRIKVAYSTHGRRIDILLVDLEDADDAHIAAERWTQYVESYIQEQDTTLDPRKHRIFMPRLVSRRLPC